MFKLKIFFKNTGASSIIISVLLIIFTIIALNGYYMVYSLTKSTKYDSFLINKLGQIRGNIQRYAKFKLIKHKDKLYNIEESLEFDFKTIKMLIEHFPNTIPKNYKIEFYNTFLNLYTLWENIKKAKKDKIILIQSEKAWIVADKITSLMQKISEKKIEGISNKFATIMLFTLSAILLLIYFVYRVIRVGLKKTSITDSLTTLYNRLYFNEQIVYNIEKYNRYDEPFSMMLFDIDNFKKINDTYGHNEGDRVLKEIAKVIKKNIRKNDLAFRYGGEEFVIIFPKTKLNEANLIAQRIKSQIEQNVKVYGKPITISGAVGEYEDEGIFKFIQKIDNKLYEAKRTGKNKVLLVGS